MDYEKKYNDALADMKVIYPNLKGDAKKAVEHAFPELKESEDERIRKALLRCCDDWEKGQFGCMAKEDVPAIRAYLEKQKEQKDYNKLYEDIAKSEWFKKAYEGKSLGCDYEQKEQQPAEWSDIDELKLQTIEAVIARQKGSAAFGGFLPEELIDYLKSLHPQPHWKPSDEQMRALENCVNGWQDSADGVLESLYNELKRVIKYEIH